jgi:flavin-dependent dehydrogenase
MIDVLIAGGGVAGCAAAIGLAPRGFSVGVLDRSHPCRDHIGETLAPSIRGPLAELGLWSQFLADGHAPCYGTYSAWGTPELYSNDFLFHPNGTGWQVNRELFDAMLVRAAGEAGAVFYPGAAPDRIEETSAGWNVTVRSHEGRLQLTARFLIDATGRSACVARRMGARRITMDRGVAIARCYDLAPGQTAPHSFMLVEASENGWWYSALLPSGQVAALFFTDPEYRHRADMPAHTAARLYGSRCAAEPRVYAASSSCLDHTAGPNWLALGDAASTWDPLSSQGIAKALQSSAAAVGVVSRRMAGDARAALDYDGEARAQFARYLVARQYYYGREKRWPASLFWQRRQGSGSGPNASSPGDDEERNRSTRSRICSKDGTRPTDHHFVCELVHELQSPLAGSGDHGEGTKSGELK